MTDQEQIDALKAQVNCLREALLCAITYREGTVNYGDPLGALDMTPEQCLAEVKANAIEDAVRICSSASKHGDICEAKCLLFYANQLREQTK